MTLRPTISPLFATDATLGTGVESALSPRLDPGAGVRARGLLPNARFPARWFNSIRGVVGDWLAYLDEKTQLVFNVKSFGAVGNGSTNDTAAVQACLDACQSAGGGFVLCPPGVYRVIAALTVPQNCTLVGVWGQSRIQLDHASEHFFVLGGGSYSLRLVDITLDAQQVNTGTVFRTVGSDNFLSLERCAINDGGFLRGLLAVGLHSITINGEDSRLTSGYTSSAFWLSATYLRVAGGRMVMAPAATAPLIGNSGSSGRVNLRDVRFSQVATGPGGASFVDVSTGRTVAEGCSFDVDSSGAGGASYAFNLNGGQLNNAACAFDRDCVPYLFGAPAAADSSVQPGPGILYSAGAAAPIVIPDGAASARVTSTLSTAPTVRLPNTLCAGQAFDVSLFNGGGSTWSGQVAWKKADGTAALTEDPTAFAGLAVGQSLTMHFTVVEISGGLYWHQVGKVAVLT